MINSFSSVLWDRKRRFAVFSSNVDSIIACGSECSDVPLGVPCFNDRIVSKFLKKRQLSI